MKSKNKKNKWDEIKKDVMTRICILEAMQKHMKPEEYEIVHNEIILPIIEKLAEFCACFDIDEDDVVTFKMKEK